MDEPQVWTSFFGHFDTIMKTKTQWNCFQMPMKCCLQNRTYIPSCENTDELIVEHKCTRCYSSDIKNLNLSHLTRIECDASFHPHAWKSIPILAMWMLWELVGSVLTLHVVFVNINLPSTQSALSLLELIKLHLPDTLTGRQADSGILKQSEWMPMCHCSIQ